MMKKKIKPNESIHFLLNSLNNSINSIKYLILNKY